MTVLKIDIDAKFPEEWFSKWIDTRISLLKSMGYVVGHIFPHETTKGRNFFIHIKPDCDANTTNMLQFLLGDDHTRVKINAWRISRGIKHWNKIFDRKLWRRGAKTIECWYCGNRIPLIGVGKNAKKE